MKDRGEEVHEKARVGQRGQVQQYELRVHWRRLQKRGQGHNTGKKNKVREVKIKEKGSRTEENREEKKKEGKRDGQR